MGRIGLHPREVPAFAQQVAEQPGLWLEGIMSHLAVADDPSQDDYTRGQINAFRAVVAELERIGRTPCAPRQHRGRRFPEPTATWCLGLGLLAASMCRRPAIAIFVAHTPGHAGSSIGYGRTYRTDHETRIGLVGLGYNDGLPRLLSNRGAVSVRDQRVPIVGNVCMDVTMVDLTAVPEAQVGDDVIVYGSGEHGEPTVQQVAAWASTIPYEILCRISPRVRRIIRLRRHDPPFCGRPRGSL
jgi:alanine racemase